MNLENNPIGATGYISSFLSVSIKKKKKSCFYAQIKKKKSSLKETQLWFRFQWRTETHSKKLHPILPVSSHWPTAGLLTDAVSPHYTLRRSDAPGTYVRALFVDVSSSLSTILPDRLATELLHLRVTRPICECSVGSLILTGSNSCIPGSHLPAVLDANTCAPRGCGPFPFSFHSVLMTGSQAASSSLLSSHRRQEPPGKGCAVVSRIGKHGF